MLAPSRAKRSRMLPSGLSNILCSRKWAAPAGTSTGRPVAGSVRTRSMLPYRVA